MTDTSGAWVPVSTTELIEQGVLEIGDGYRAKNSELAETGIPFARVANLRDGFEFQDADLFPLDGLDKVGAKRSRQGDCVITMKGSVGRVAFVSPQTPEFVYSPQLSYWRSLRAELLDPMFLRYWLQGQEFVDQCKQVKGSTDMADYVSLTDQRRMCITLPDHTSQVLIGRCLGAFDDLIENNRRRIELLEETARLPYREWFVHFRYPGHEDVPLVESELGLIPEGWEVGVLGDVADEIRNSVKPSPETQLMPYVPIDAISPKQITLGKKRPGTEAKSSLRHFKTGDVLFGAMRAYFHKVAQAPFEGLTRSTCFVLRPHLGRYYFTLMKLADETTVAFAAANSTGSTIPYAHWDGVLSQMETVIPPEEVAGDFGEIIRPLLEICQALTQQGELLRETRDLLLPRLVSGDLDISGLELDLEAVG